MAGGEPVRPMSTVVAGTVNCEIVLDGYGFYVRCLHCPYVSGASSRIRFAERGRADRKLHRGARRERVSCLPAANRPDKQAGQDKQRREDRRQ